MNQKQADKAAKLLFGTSASATKTAVDAHRDLAMQHRYGKSSTEWRILEDDQIIGRGDGWIIALFAAARMKNLNMNYHEVKEFIARIK